jgi:molybdenum cofactor guanylyltransferase
VTDPSGITAIVLAGGRSTRFGSPKLSAELDGLPLLDHALRAVGAVADAIILVGASSPIPTTEVGSALSIRVIPDDEPFAGPLAALAGALRATAPGFAIVIGGDMPGLVPTVLEAMLARLASNDDLDAVVLASPTKEPERRQVLPLAVRVGTASTAAAEAVRNGDRSLVRLLERLQFVEVPAREWLAFDPAGRTLLDVDRPEDLERIHQNFR